MASSDRDLVVRIRAGDLDAFGTLLARYREPFLRYARHMVGCPEDAEEAAQDAFLRIYRNIGQCDPDRFAGWGYRILVNRCRSALRRRRWWRLGAVGLEPATGLAASGHESAQDTAEEINRGLARLPAEQREAFLLKHVDGMSYGEMADITGASIPALKMRVSRACDRLRAQLGGAR